MNLRKIIGKIFQKKSIVMIGGLVSIIAPIGFLASCTDEKKIDSLTLPKGIEKPIEKLNAVDAGKKVISYYIGDQVNNIKFKKIAKEKYINQPSATMNDVYEYQVINGQLVLKASSGVAFAHGFYQWIKENGYGMVDWGGIHNIKIPKNLISTNKITKVVSPYKIHYYLNPVSFGYTMPFWGEKEWIEYLNWLAMHGYDMTLSLNATEGIVKRTFSKMGLLDKDFIGFFNSPALAPWQRMGNIAGWRENPYQSDFDNKQIVLQSKILNRMRERNITPIVQGFGGFVPSTITKSVGLYDEFDDPIEDLTPTTWAGWPAKYKSNLLDPKTEQFRIIGTETIKTYQNVFGNDIKYFLSDTFNEMPAPSSQDVMTISRNIYESIHAADPEAVWVTQGWMFIYSRGSWNQDKFDGFTGLDDSGNSPIPSDKMLILNYATDYAYTEYYTKTGPSFIYYDGFKGKNWAYGSVPTMGGKTSMTGIFRFLTEGGSRAIEWNKKNGNKTNLIGFGSSMEGFENNTILQEAISDVGWKEKIYDIPKWISKYAKTRYKLSGEPLQKAIESITKIINDGGALSNFVDHPKPTYQFGSVTQGGSAIVENDQQQQAYLDLVKAVKGAKSQKQKIVNLLEMDLREWSVNLIGTKLDQLLYEYLGNFMPNNKKHQAEKDALEMLDDMDEILAGHPILNIKRWIKQAEAWGDTLKEKKYYLGDAQNIITLWGLKTHINNYALKTWAGVIKGYYKYKLNYLFQNGHRISNTDDHIYVENTNFGDKMSLPKSIDQVLSTVDHWFPKATIERIYNGSPTLINFKIDLRNIGSSKHVASSTTNSLSSPVTITKNNGDNSYTYQMTISQKQKEKLVSGKYMFELSRNSANRSPAKIDAVEINLNGTWIDVVGGSHSLGSATLIHIKGLNGIKASGISDIRVKLTGGDSKLLTKDVDGIRQVVDGSIMFRNLYSH